MFDPSCAHVTIGNQRYQVLKPERFGTVEVGTDEETGEPIIEQRPLPREWDETATMAMVNRDHPPADPEPETQPVFKDITD